MGHGLLRRNERFIENIEGIYTKPAQTASMGWKRFISAECAEEGRL